MDHNILKKRLNTFKSAKGTLRQVSSDVVIEVLRAWEHWPGSAADLYRELGLSKMQLVTMIQKAKRLVKSGAVIETDFKEIHVDQALSEMRPTASPPGGFIELTWEAGKLIRFCQVEQLIEFLKKVA